MLITRIHIFLLFIIVTSSNGLIADPALEGRVVNVLAGDLLIVSVDRQAEIVQLYGVDCPDRDEIGWLQVREFTRKMILNKDIHIQKIGPKRAGRIRAIVYFGDRCVNDSIVDAGLARAVKKEH